jgi:hypothetical protein
MRSAALAPAFALLLAACATPPQPDPDASVRGCWIARSGEQTTTMRWLPRPNRTEILYGDLLVYAPSGTTNARYALELLENGWRLCSLANGDIQTCWPVAEGREGSVDEGRAFIDAYRERLRIAVVEATGERVIFDGQRDGCD